VQPSRLVTRPLFSTDIGSLFLVSMAIALEPSAQAGVIDITHGGTYTFAIGNNNPNIPAVEIKTTELVRLYRCTISSMGRGIQATDGNASVQMDSCTIWIVPPGGDAILVHNPGPECLVSHCSISGATKAIRDL
jgi:hypothetical protein